MQRVKHFLRQAEAARKLAATADTDKARSDFTEIAEAWEQLATERASLLQESGSGHNAMTGNAMPESKSDGGMDSP